MKKFILSLTIVGLISLGAGYFGTSLIAKNSNIPQTQVAKEEVFDKAKELSTIENLVKTYIISSVNYDWETIQALASGEYKKQLKEKIIPNAEKLKKEKYKFNPRSMKVSVQSLKPEQAIVNVSYIVSKDNLPIQEDITLFLGKENNRWVIVSVETKS